MGKKATRAAAVADSEDFVCLLTSIHEGRRFFAPSDTSPTALAVFQGEARLVLQAAAQGLVSVEGIVRSKGSDTLDWFLAIEVSGLTPQGSRHIYLPLDEIGGDHFAQPEASAWTSAERSSASP